MFNLDYIDCHLYNNTLRTSICLSVSYFGFSSNNYISSYEEHKIRIYIFTNNNFFEIHNIYNVYIFLLDPLIYNKY